MFTKKYLGRFQKDTVNIRAMNPGSCQSSLPLGYSHLLFFSFYDKSLTCICSWFLQKRKEPAVFFLSTMYVSEASEYIVVMQTTTICIYLIKTMYYAGQIVSRDNRFEKYCFIWIFFYIFYFMIVFWALSYFSTVLLRPVQTSSLIE